jgi:peptide/nickel transport system substrate-binding protein
VKFHNGKPFDASDVLFTYKRILDKEVASVLRVNFSIVDNIEAVDPLTVRFTLSTPYADLPAAAAGYQALIVSESIVDTLTTHPIGTGPFRFVEYRPGDQMTLERNPDYFLPGVPTLDRAILRVIPEYTTAVSALESGAVDVVYDLPPEQVDNVKRSTVAHTEEVVAGRWQGIIWNCEMKPFDDPRVRRAFSKLVDKPALTDIAMFGHGTPTLTPIPPLHPYFRKDIPIGGADIPGAKRLLAEAGIPEGFTLEMYVPGANPPRERLATAFRDSAKQAGVNVQLRMVPPDKFFAEMEGKVLFSAAGFYGRATPDLMVYPWYHSTGSWNNTLWHYHNPEVDKVLDAARATSSTTEQATLRPLSGARARRPSGQRHICAELCLRHQQQGEERRRLAADVARHHQSGADLLRTSRDGRLCRTATGRRNGHHCGDVDTGVPRHTRLAVQYRGLDPRPVFDAGNPGSA